MIFKKKIKKTMLYVILTVFILVFSFPLIWLFLMAFKLERDIFSSPPVWIPSEFTLEHFSILFTEFDFGTTIINSTITASTTTLITLAISSISAYALSRYDFKGSNIILMGIFFTRMTIPAALLIPLYDVLDIFALIDTPVALILGQLIWTVPGSV